MLRYIIRRASEVGVRLIDYGEGNTLYKCELANGPVSGMVVTVAARVPVPARLASTGTAAVLPTSKHPLARTPADIPLTRAPVGMTHKAVPWT